MTIHYTYANNRTSAFFIEFTQLAVIILFTLFTGKVYNAIMMTARSDISLLLL